MRGLDSASRSSRVVVAATPLFVTSGSLLNSIMMTLYAAALGAGVEHPRRLRRPVLVRPCAVLRHRRLRDGGAAGEARRQRLGGAAGRAGRGRRGRRARRRAVVPLRAARARTSRSSRWPSPRCSASSRCRFDFTGGGVGLMVPLNASASPSCSSAVARGYLWLVLALVVAGGVISWWLQHSRFGA